ncbi:hypothetical protein D1AOALGA4SA_6788 [Olavius algarvensis Delta 1 endosymbiont]|nr:hypothetical protein D1AOALGA4SA_6788 [Olavius algarvensis Delta 1 endosymbiont]
MLRLADKLTKLTINIAGKYGSCDAVYLYHHAHPRTIKLSPQNLF